MRVLGISPLDKDATAAIVEDGRILFAAGEERFSRVKQHKGFPQQAIEAGLKFTGLRTDDIDAVAYAFFPWDREAELMAEGFAHTDEQSERFPSAGLQRLLDEADGRVPTRSTPIPGLGHPNEKMEKGFAKERFYQMAGITGMSRKVTQKRNEEHRARSRASHQRWQQELETGLHGLGLLGKLKRFEHHESHAAAAYHMSGFERALIVTLDGYGSGLAAAVSLGENGTIKRLHSVKFPNSLGSFYESVTSSLGFKPSRHEGKIVGLAAYGDPSVLKEVLLSRFMQENGTYLIRESTNIYFSRYLASRFPKIDVAAAYQHVLEIVAANLVRHWIRETGCDALVLSGGVVANVKMNQRLYEVEGVRRLFVDPDMGDGGCGTGLALHMTWPGGVRDSITDAYYGPSFTPAEMRAELERAGLPFSEPGDLATEAAQRISEGQVIARFDGRMEYGPRALGNRSIMYHARDPHVNQWLNQRLGRTEFMPFAPVTLWESRHDCYQNIAGAEHAAEFMTVTFDCTEWMRKNCPAAVHVDGTARPQLVKREVNAGYYDILKAYERISGSPTLINTSFNMHEEPIVCSPHDAVRAFLLGNLDGLILGPYFVPNPKSEEERKGALASVGESR